MPIHRFKIAKSMMIPAMLVLAVLLICSAGIAQAADKDPEFVKAARKGDLKGVTALLNCGQDINAKNRDGETALMAAAGAGNLDVVKYLIGKGADTKVRDRNGRTVLLHAADNLDVVTFLFEKGADPIHDTVRFPTDVKIPITKIFIVLMILWYLFVNEGKHADHSAFFARQKWTMRDAYVVVYCVTGFVFTCSVWVPLWYTAPASYIDLLMFAVCWSFFAQTTYYAMGGRHGATWTTFGIDKTHFLEAVAKPHKHFFNVSIAIPSSKNALNMLI